MRSLDRPNALSQGGTPIALPTDDLLQFWPSIRAALATLPQFGWQATKVVIERESALAKRELVSRKATQTNAGGSHLSKRAGGKREDDRTTDNQRGDRKNESAESPVYLGEARYRVGGDVIQLEYAENKVLSRLVELGAAKKSDLEKANGNAVTILRQIKRKKAYSELAPHIIFPGGKGKGGYKTTIVPMSSDVFQSRTAAPTKSSTKSPTTQ